MQILTSMRPLARRYSLMLLDLWGVMHNGVEIFPHAKECLQKLRAEGVKVIFVSNAPRKAAVIANQLRSLGLAERDYDGVISSGEVGREALRKEGGAGKKCLHIGSRRDYETPEGLGLESVDKVEEADFILNSGPEDGATVADYHSLLDKAARLKVPMVCLNPDLEVIRGDARMPCAGALARRLEDLGGEVRYHGKPFPPIYHRAMALVGRETTGNSQFSDVLVVGDSLNTDIAGANGIKCDSVLVLGGIHHVATRGADGNLSTTRLRALLSDKPRPSAVMERFSW